VSARVSCAPYAASRLLSYAVCEKLLRTLVAARPRSWQPASKWREEFWCGKFIYDHNPFELRCERAGSNTGDRGMPDRWASF
jgi:hypothetical protein